MAKVLLPALLGAALAFFAARTVARAEDMWLYASMGAGALIGIWMGGRMRYAGGATVRMFAWVLLLLALAAAAVALGSFLLDYRGELGVGPLGAAALAAVPLLLSGWLMTMAAPGKRGRFWALWWVCLLVGVAVLVLTLLQ